MEEEELSVATRTLRAVEPARRVGAVAGAGGECEASELQSRVLTGEEAAPHTPELRDEHRAVAEGAGRHGVAPALGGARRGDEAEKLVRVVRRLAKGADGEARNADLAQPAQNGRAGQAKVLRRRLGELGRGFHPDKNRDVDPKDQFKFPMINDANEKVAEWRARGLLLLAEGRWGNANATQQRRNDRTSVFTATALRTFVLTIGTSRRSKREMVVWSIIMKLRLMVLIRTRTLAMHRLLCAENARLRGFRAR